MVHVILAGPLGGIGDDLLRLALGADEEHPSAAGDDVPDRAQRAVEQRHGLRQVDDVDPVALPVNVGGHLGIPAVGLMPEVDASLEQLAQTDLRQRHHMSPLPVPAFRGR